MADPTAQYFYSMMTPSLPNSIREWVFFTSCVLNSLFNMHPSQAATSFDGFREPTSNERRPLVPAHPVNQRIGYDLQQATYQIRSKRPFCPDMNTWQRLSQHTPISSTMPPYHLHHWFWWSCNIFRPLQVLLSAVKTNAATSGVSPARIVLGSCTSTSDPLPKRMTLGLIFISSIIVWQEFTRATVCALL